VSLTAEVKLRTLAMNDSDLIPLFFTPQARWFGPQLNPGYIRSGSCVTVQRISTEFIYAMEGNLTMNRPRFQLDVLDLDADTARQNAKAVRDWLGTINLVTDSQLSSPTTTPENFPTTILDERQRAITQTEGLVYIECIDFRIYCSE